MTVLKKEENDSQQPANAVRGQIPLRNGDVIDIGFFLFVFYQSFSLVPVFLFLNFFFTYLTIFIQFFYLYCSNFLLGKVLLTFFVEYGPSLTPPPTKPPPTKPPPTQSPSAILNAQSNQNISPVSSQPTTPTRVGPDGQLTPQIVNGPNGQNLQDIKKIFPGLKGVINSNGMSPMSTTPTTSPNVNIANNGSANMNNPGMKRMMPQNVLGMLSSLNFIINFIIIQ